MSKENSLASNSGKIYLPPELQQDIQRRLMRIESHIRDMGRLLGEPNGCEDLLTEVTAVKATIDQVTVELLEGHLEVCMTRGLQAGEDGFTALEQFHRAMAAVLKHA